MENSKYKIDDKVIFNSQVFIVTYLEYRSLGYWYFIKGYNKGNNIRKIILEKYLEIYKNEL